MLIKAIKENWSPPKAYLSAKTQAGKELQEQKAIKRVEEKKSKEQARRKARQKKISEIKTKISKQEFANLRQRAKQKLARVLHNVYSKDNLPETLINAEIDYLIGTEYLKIKQIKPPSSLPTVE